MSDHLTKVRNVLERMNRKGGMGHDVHGWIDDALDALDALAQAGQAAPAGEVASNAWNGPLSKGKCLHGMSMAENCPACATSTTEPAAPSESEKTDSALPDGGAVAPGYVSDEEIHRIADETFRDYVEDRNDDADIAFARAVLAAASKTGGA